MKLTHRFGLGSRRELVGVHSDLVIVVSLALQISTQDFTVFDGVRTRDEQREYMRRGVSWTMNSMHLPQASGYGHAVDLVPYIAGGPRWDSIDAFKVVGAAMREAAAHYRVAIVWGANIEHGGDWRTLNDMAHFELA